MPDENGTRDYYVVEIFEVQRAGRELIWGSKDQGFHLSAPEPGSSEIMESRENHAIWWYIKGTDREIASKKFYAFDDYAAAARYSAVNSIGSPFPALGRIVFLWVIPAPTKLQAIRELETKQGAAGQCKLETYPPIFWEVELIS